MLREERLKDINPDIVINKHRTFYTPETSKNSTFQKYDYVVDAIDTVTGKIELVMQADKAKRLSSVQWGQATSLILQRLRLPTFTKPRSVLLQGL